VTLALILIVAVLALALTNPSASEHREAVSNALRTQASREGFLSRLDLEVTLGLDAIPFRYRNYVVFSTLTVDGKTVSWGLLANVIVKD
jgi:presenilin-like A22 family membrane protease